MHTLIELVKLYWCASFHYKHHYRPGDMPGLVTKGWKYNWRCLCRKCYMNRIVKC